MNSSRDAERKNSLAASVVDISLRLRDIYFHFDIFSDLSARIEHVCRPRVFGELVIRLDPSSVCARREMHETDFSVRLN